MPTALLLSDVHGRYDLFSDMLDADFCLIAGDITNQGENNWGEFYRSQRWMEALSQKYRHVIYIYGNHDLRLTKHCYNFPNVHCIQDELLELEGIRFYGVNMSPCYNRPKLALVWTNMTARLEVERAAYAMIPENVDVLLSHCPPWQCLDRTRDGEHIGSDALREYIEQKAPRLVVCGHVHESSGAEQIGRTLVINTAECYTKMELSWLKGEEECLP